MAIDKSQFFQIFFEETSEHLVEMERLLLGLNLEAPNLEDLQAIFRAVHSVKGGAGTFGFKNLVDVSHVLESVLDKVRNEELHPTTEMVDLFLQTGDVLKEILSGHKEGEKVDPGNAAEVCERLEKIGNTGAGGAGTGEEDNKPTEDPGYGFFDDIPPIPQEPDPGYGFFDEVLSGPQPPAPDPRTSDSGSSSSGPSQRRGRRATDLSDDAEIPMRAGRRASDKMVVAHGESSSLRVGVDKIDKLVNQVGELVITQAMVAQTASTVDREAFEKLQDGLTQLERNTRDLQESVMAMRMVPINSMFSRFPRLVRDLAGKLSKQVELKINGGETELDKGLTEKLIDPLTHLVRNSLDHGVETPEQRTAAGKDPKGTITLSASHQGGNVVIEVSDDGGGLNKEKIFAKAATKGIALNENASDQEIYQLIFAAGFSTADAVTDVSGRGVGLDVVKKNVKTIGGRVEVHSEPGQGSKFVIRLPLTLAIIEGMSVRVGQEIYIFPITSITESIRPGTSQVKTIFGKGEVVAVRGEFLTIVRLYQKFSVPTELTNPTEAVLVVVESEGKRSAIMVDELVGQQQVVIKNLSQNFRKVEGVAGATILGDGKVAFILDIQDLLGSASRKEATVTG